MLAMYYAREAYKNLGVLIDRLDPANLDIQTTIWNLSAFLDNEHDKGCDDGHAADTAMALMAKLRQETIDPLTFGEIEFIEYVEEVFGEFSEL